MSRERMLKDIQRIRNGYMEVPNLSLTDTQFTKYFHVSPEQAQVITNELVQSGFLVRRDDKYRMPSSC